MCFGIVDPATRERVLQSDEMIFDMELDTQCVLPNFSIVTALQAQGAKRVLDVATGTGFYSAQLLDAGFEVVSVDTDMHRLNMAFDYALEKGHRLNTVRADWQSLHRRVGNGYDAVICLGNAFASLFKLLERRRVLAEFFSVLNVEGVLCVDHRNFDAVLNNPVNDAQTYVYDPPGLRVEPVFVDSGLVRWAYEEDQGDTRYRNTYPLLKQDLRRSMLEVGFRDVDSFALQKNQERGDAPDFWVHIAHKE